MRHMCTAHTREVEERVCVLYVWANTVEALLACTRDVGRMLGVQKHLFQSQWPMINYTPATDAHADMPSCLLDDDEEEVG